MNIWVDADSCLEKIRVFICKTAARLSVHAFFTANRPIPFPANKFTKMIIADDTPDAADNIIVEKAGPDDLVITRDIPLASRLVEKGITVINDRGTVYTGNNIRERLSLRNFMFDLYQNGFMPEKTAAYSQKDFNNFANCFDREIQKKLKQNAAAQSFPQP